MVVVTFVWFASVVIDIVGVPSVKSTYLMQNLNMCTSRPDKDFLTFCKNDVTHFSKLLPITNPKLSLVEAAVFIVE